MSDPFVDGDTEGPQPSVVKERIKQAKKEIRPNVAEWLAAGFSLPLLREEYWDRYCVAIVITKTMRITVVIDPLPREPVWYVYREWRGYLPATYGKKNSRKCKDVDHVARRVNSWIRKYG